MLDALLDAGAEIFLFETFADFEYILPAVQYVRKQVIEKHLPFSPVIMVSFCLNKFGCTKTGISASSLVKTAADSGIIDIIGFNCGVGSTHMKHIIQKLDFGDMPVSIAPNSGYPDVIRDRNIYRDNVGYFCENMMEIASIGVNILGGWCGTTPQYIHELWKQLQLHSGAGENFMKMRHHISISTADRGIDKTRNDFLNKLNVGKKVIAVELDPPQNGNTDKIIQASALLKQTGVDMITFSDSPMGRMRADSIASSILVSQQTDIAAMPHICCRDRNAIAMGGAFFGANAMFVKNEMSGIQVPDEIITRYDENMSREEGEQVGITISLEIIAKLQDIAEGYYFMVPFNRASMICKIIEKM